MSEIPSDFKYLGYDFQKKAIAQILSDRAFGNKALIPLESSYFDDKILKFIFQCIKEHFNKYESVPALETVQIIINDEVRSEKELKVISDVINEIKSVDLKDSEKIKDIIEEFCTQQALKNAVKTIQKLIDKGDFKEFEKSEEIVRKALNLFADDGGEEDVFDNIDETLADDYREVIPTGIVRLDAMLEGGLGRGEVGICIAPLGTGKTTLATKFANTAASCGYNVVQIFLEDKIKEVRRKHFACWSGIEINELKNNKEKVKELITEYKETIGKKLKLKKFSALGTKMVHIKNYIKKLVLEGWCPDLIIIDYIDVIEADSNADKDDYGGEGYTMRQFENLTEEFNAVGWTFVQSGRAGINKELVTAEHTGGNLKKSQFGHLIMSLARTTLQQEKDRATLAILKSRFCKTKVFENILFNNSKIVIDLDDTSEEMTFMERVEKKEIQKNEKLQNIIEKVLNKKEE